MDSPIPPVEEEAIPSSTNHKNKGQPEKIWKKKKNPKQLPCLILENSTVKIQDQNYVRWATTKTKYSRKEDGP